MITYTLTMVATDLKDADIPCLPKELYKNSKYNCKMSYKTYLRCVLNFAKRFYVRIEKKGVTYHITKKKRRMLAWISSFKQDYEV